MHLKTAAAGAVAAIRRRKSDGRSAASINSRKVRLKSAFETTALAAIAEGATAAQEVDVSGRIHVVQAVTHYFEQAAARGIVRDVDREMLILVFFFVLIGITPLQLLMGDQQAVSAAAIDAKSATAVKVLELIAAGGRLRARPYA
jgi:hypothetical protein